jgi:hypothetical protein
MNPDGAPPSLLNGIGVCFSFAIECKRRALLSSHKDKRLESFKMSLRGTLQVEPMDMSNYINRKKCDYCTRMNEP